MNKLIKWLVWASSFIFKSSATIYILVPGTWADEDGWSTPLGSFYQQLASTIEPQDRVVPFSWSGKNAHASRLIASNNLAALIQSYPSSSKIILIAHSHGGNIAFLASQKLATFKEPNTITSMILLGVPINESEYPPHPTIIKQCINFFSFSDFIQPVFGYFGRILSMQPHHINASVTVNNIEPSHEDMHHELIGKYLVALVTFCANQSGLFHMDVTPDTLTMQECPDLIDEIENDQYLVQKFTGALIRSKKTTRTGVKKNTQ